MIKIILPVAAFIFAAPDARAADITTVGDIARGKKIAEQHCSRCHVIGKYNKYGGISSTPSFQLLVNAIPDYHERFSTFYVRPPHPAVINIKGFEKRDKLPYNAAPIEFLLEDIENILAFVMTLRKGP